MTEPKTAQEGPMRSKRLLNTHASAIKELQKDVARLKANALELENIIVVIDGNLLTAEVPMRRGPIVI